MEQYPSLIKQHKPQSNEIWYHYCSAESFMDIIKNKTLRLTDLRHMNDMEELILGERLLNELLETEEKGEYIRAIYDFFKPQIIQLSMSFSENIDQLSQWRGYADDARGFCIGFKAENFNKLPVHLLKVEYQISEQKKLIRNAINKIVTYLSDIQQTNTINFESALLIAELFELFSILKNNSFREEKEYRLVYAIFVDEKNGGKLIDFNKKKESYKDCIENINFRLVDNVPTPFVDLKYNTLAPISQIVIGPKNQSKESDIKTFISTNGMYNIKITKSSSTYR